MCGITGVWHITGRSVDTMCLHHATNLISHRGPDDEGFLRINTQTTNFTENLTDNLAADLAFGFRRLAILDLSPAGHQPMSYSDGAYWVIFNGEIYNYLELRDELKLFGYNFRSGSDTEVILAAYAQWGPACLERFNGMWAFALWDSRQKTLFCARDRFGIKPFYYVWENGSFAFASEIKALLPLMERTPTPNDELLFDFLFYGWNDHKSETFFEGIQELRPAHYISLRDGKLICRRYWDLDPKHHEIMSSDQAYSERFREIFEDAVRLHLRSDVAVGTCLSGGLDSSSIVCIANHLLLDEHALPSELVGEHQKTFSSCFDDSRFDERPFIEQVLSTVGAEKNFVFPSGADLVRILPRLLWHQEQPFGSTSIFAQWSVMERVAQRGVRVLLDGQGADELLAGYHTYFHYFWSSLVRQGNLSLLKHEIKEYQRRYSQPAWRSAMQIGQHFTPPQLAHWARRYKRTGASVGALGLNPGFVRAHQDRFYKPTNWRGDLFEDYLFDGLTSHSLPALLRYEDRDAMAHSIEARVPFLDYRLVEFAFAIPADQKIRNATTKVILRNAMQGTLPEDVRNRRDKMGFVTPEKVWLQAELGTLVRDVAHSSSFEQRGYFDVKKIQKLIIEHQKGTRDIAFIASRWLTVELWFRQFIDNTNVIR
jgi:asparagine synthase (glutamine-hydrolysing)